MDGKYDLYCFDLDDTLSERYSSEVKPHVLEWFKQNQPVRVAICTNQEGVGLRYWMETAGFGDPSGLPTEEEVQERLAAVAAALAAASPRSRIVTLYSLAYQSKGSGKWSPTPAQKHLEPAWDREWRKPAPGMIYQALFRFRVRPDRCLFVGNSEDDRRAAENARTDYMDEKQFFWSVKIDA